MCPATTLAASNGGGDEVLLLGYHWHSVRTNPATNGSDGWYEQVRLRASDIADLGITTVWMPPPWRDQSCYVWDGVANQSCSPLLGSDGKYYRSLSSGTGGGEGYFYSDFNKNGAYGTDQQLIDAVNAIKSTGVKIIYDMVLNHRNSFSIDGDPSNPGAPFLYEMSMEAAEKSALLNSYAPGSYEYDYWFNDLAVNSPEWSRFGEGGPLGCGSGMWVRSLSNPAGAFDSAVDCGGYWDGMSDVWRDVSGENYTYDGQPYALGYTDYFGTGDRDLNWDKAEVQDAFFDEGRNLVDNYGADGFRFDFVRGVPPWAISQFMSQSGLPSEAMCVGELWKSPADYNYVMGSDWKPYLSDFSSNANCSVLDFALKNEFQTGNVANWRYGMNSSDPWRRAHAFTFVDGHDTGASPEFNGNWGQQLWEFSGNKFTGYTYILTSPGTPVIYWPDVLDSNPSTPGWGLYDHVKWMIELRKDAGIRADSEIAWNADNSYTTTGDYGSIFVDLDAGVTSCVGACDSGTGMKRITLTCHNGSTYNGQSVYAVGDQPQLGNWSPANAPKMDPTDYPSWTLDIELPADASVEFKCVKREEDDPNSGVQWQNGGNNSFSVSAGSSYNAWF